MAANGSSGKYVRNREVIFASFPEGPAKESDFEVKESEIDLSLKAGSGDVVVKLMYISLDPYYRGRMMKYEGGLYFPSFQIGMPLEGGVIGKVLASDSSSFKAEDVVTGLLSFSEYLIVPKGEGIRRLDTKGLPPSYFLGVCGMPGLTAWVGLKLIGQPKPGEHVYVSTASGAVGQIVGQLAKIYGCHVVGSASTAEKVKLLKTELGYDDAFNYKEEKDLQATLTKYFPKGIDIYFDNVGGETLEAVLGHVNPNARIPMCGAISQYNLESKDLYGIKNLFNAIGKSVKMQGFLVGAYFEEYLGPYIEEVSGYLKEGKLKYSEHVTDGIENWPEAFVGMMSSKNLGKALVSVGN